jgi:hypothetical protein
MMINDRKYNSLTIQEPTPEGTAFITVVEDKPGEIVHVDFQIGKSGTTVRTYTYAMAQLVTFLFEKGCTIKEVIDRLTDIASDRAPRLTAGGSYNRSGAEALASALRQYENSIVKEIKVNV